MNSYIDTQNKRGCVAVFATDEEGKPKEIIQAGTTINSMPSRYKNQYLVLEKNNEVLFIFDDDVPKIDFYAVPRIDIFARDNKEGYFGTVGNISDVDDLEAPICYIDKNKNVFKAANCMNEFVLSLENVMEFKNMELMTWVSIFNSIEEAKEKLDFMDIE